MKFIGSVFELAYPTLLQRIPSERSDCTISSPAYLLEVLSHPNYPDYLPPPTNQSEKPEGRRKHETRIAAASAPALRDE
jgi:hypothetical protein